MKHGANIYKYASKIGVDAQEIIDFSSNINTYHPDIDIKLTNAMLVKYGDTSYTKLKDNIAAKYTLKKKQITLFNGATSAIFELFKALNEKKVYLYAPLYGEYEKAAKLTKKKIIKINRFKKLHKKPKKNSIVVFVNPSTPDAKYYDLKRLFKVWKKQNCTIILDESFLEFENLISFRNEINKYKNLYIIQSFSKFYSCAGVRIGAIFSHKKNLKQFHFPLWHLSSFDTKFLSKRIIDTRFDKKSKNLHKTHKKKLYNILKKSKLFTKIYPSEVNFFLVKTTKAKALFEYLLRHKILVRTCDSFDFLDKNHLRFAVKDTYAHDALKSKLLQFGT